MRFRLYKAALALTLIHGGCGRLGFTIGGNDVPNRRGAVGQGDFATLPTLQPLKGKHLLYTRDERILRREAIVDAEENDVTTDLDAVFPGLDQFVGASRSGEWMTLGSDRLACGGDQCLTLVRRDMSYFRRVLIGDDHIVLEGRAAVNDDADMIVFPAVLEGGPHAVDLYATARIGEEWSLPLLLTGDIDKEYSTQPVFDSSGTRVLFDCGSTPASQDDTSICEVQVGVSPAVVLIDVANNPNTTPGPHALHHADYAGDGTMVFESTWAGSEHVWKRSGSTNTLILAETSNDNTPCAFSDGTVASLWLNRPGGAGLHELKTMDINGMGQEVLAPDVDQTDSGLSCIGSL